jgi:hypothetical protein
MTNEQAALPPELRQAFSAYEAAGRKDPELNQVNELLQKAGERGLRMSNHAFRELIKAGERGYNLTKFLVQAENFEAAKKLFDLGEEDEEKNQAEVRRLLSWVDRHGYGVQYERHLNSTDTYLEKRRKEIREGLRRR